MVRYSMVLAVISLSVSTQALAIPVGFEFSGAIDCGYGGGCEEFTADTGLEDPLHAPYVARFRLNTETPALASQLSRWGDNYFTYEEGQTYSITGSSVFTISLGNLLLEFDHFYIRVASAVTTDGPMSLISLWGHSNTHAFFFDMGDPYSARFDDFTLSELARTSLVSFNRYAVDSEVAGYVEDSRDNRRWGLTDTGFDSIRRVRVPEPPTLSVLLASMLALLVVSRRPRRQSVLRA